MGDLGYDNLVAGWSEIIEALYDGVDGFNVDEVKKLIFDTYHYYKKEVGEANIVARNGLTVYKYIGQISFFLSTNNVDGVPESVSETCADFLQGLCYVIEKNFDAGYGKNPLPIGLRRHTPAGCADPEADMTTYESFEKDFDDNVEFLRDEYDME